MNRSDRQGWLIVAVMVFTIQDRFAIVIPQGSGVRDSKRSPGFKPLVAGYRRY
ncbi:MAG: hypothetical protein MKZ63_06880 [Nitrospinales bacterium]|nr:hypothetical protein [Nitrospinales bacterium]